MCTHTRITATTCFLSHTDLVKFKKSQKIAFSYDRTNWNFRVSWKFFFLNKKHPSPKLQLNVLFLLTLSKHYQTPFSKLFLSLQMNIGLHNSHIKQLTSELSVFINIIVNLKSLISQLGWVFRTSSCWLLQPWLLDFLISQPYYHIII